MVSSFALSVIRTSWNSLTMCKEIKCFMAVAFWRGRVDLYPIGRLCIDLTTILVATSWCRAGYYVAGEEVWFKPVVSHQAVTVLIPHWVVMVRVRLAASNPMFHHIWKNLWGQIISWLGLGITGSSSSCRFCLCVVLWLNKIVICNLHRWSNSSLKNNRSFRVFKISDNTWGTGDIDSDVSWASIREPTSLFAFMEVLGLEECLI